MARGRRGRGGHGGGRRGRVRVRGKVARVVADRGFCFVEPDDLPEGYTFGRGRGIFMHQSANGNRLPSEGAVGEFEIEEGDKGLKVVRVVSWDAPTASGDRSPQQQRGASGADTFIHPYNFVRVPADGLGKAGRIEPFQRGPAASHNRYDPQRISGWLQCRLKTKTWWFIPDPRKQASEDEHKVLGYFTLDNVDAWDKDDPGQDATHPAIPASSLRGMVRSVFEDATLSCLSVFDPGVLDLRVGFDPGQTPRGTKLPNGRDNPTYVPARVLQRNADGTASIQFLGGRRDRDPDNILPVALVHAYDPRVKNRNGSTGSSTALWSGLGIPDGSEVAAIITASPTRHRSGRYHYREALEVVPADQATSLTVRGGHWLVFGYLHRTGPNIENKHHERIFFRADAPYNEQGSHQVVDECLKEFQADESPALDVPADVLQAADESLRGYAERHERALKKAPKVPRSINRSAPHPSDFVGQRRLKQGDLCYAVIEGGSTVRGLYPVAIPRLSHEDSRGDLLHRDFHPCDDPDRLCPACRVFGWVRPGKGGLSPEPGRVDAVAGRVRMTHGTLDGSWGSGDRRARLATLAILGSPKPTTTAFYLRPRQGYNQASEGRWPPVLQAALHQNIPLYRRDEASLRGRKLYRRRNVDPESHDTASGGILRPPGDDGEPRRDSQNQTIHLLPPNLDLGFRVYFDNLSREELGALVFALTLRPPSQWGSTPALWHAVGHGKPLGLGACEVTVEAVQVDVLDPASPTHRYAQIPTFRKESGATGDVAERLVTLYLEAFGRTEQQAEQVEPAIRQARGDLVEMLRADPPEGSVHYPPDPGGDVSKNYAWFVQNRQPKKSNRLAKGLGQLLPEPMDERSGTARLRRNPTEGG